MKQFVVIGLGRFGSSVARTLAERGFDVLAIDQDESLVQEMANVVTHAVQADATDENAMNALGLRNFDVAVVAIGADVHSNILATMILKEMGVRYVVAKALDPLHGKVLAKVGADRVIFPERDMGKRLALNLISSNVLDFIEFAPNYSIVEIKATKGMVGKTLAELQLRTRFGVNVIAVKAKDRINISPSASDEIREGDILVVIGENQSVERLRRL
ncbi:potassium uptake system protein [Anoxybacter fermentans]|uniref:Potassium uptake system protein n=1 Tax=Anoxybacter fermentans TaxID=1323375 RepID=A0A3S9SZF2_9FIRM|nr:TrkA family potassium uptake protein [Anoxybacter fermentans]AZR73671.1 potassium uptake system protein [Anoxybacter fermentans]